MTVCLLSTIAKVMRVATSQLDNKGKSNKIINISL